VSSGRDPLGRIHALWTLEGLFVSLPGKEAITPSATERMVRLVNADAGFTFEAPDLPPEILDACLKAIGDSNPKVQVAAIRVCESLTGGNPARRMALLNALQRLPVRTSDEVQFQAALTVGNLPMPEALPVLVQIASRGAQIHLLREAVISSLKDWEFQFLNILLHDPQWAEQRPGRPSLLQLLASAVLRERQPAKIDSLLTLAAHQSAAQMWRQRSLLEGLAANTSRSPRPIAFSRAPAAFELLATSSDSQVREQSERIKLLFAWPGHQLPDAVATARTTPAPSASAEFSLAEGKKLYQQTCAGCHGMGGEGLKPLAPPLVNSGWVTGPEGRLIRIVLHGMTGPVKVNGTSYEPPDVQPEMLPLAVLEDAQIAAILSYIRHDWGHDAPPVTPERIAAIRNETQSRELPWTEEQLLNLK
jgi:mono/diheme cytochrome c family protein